jgi:hypothetical protein
VPSVRTARTRGRLLARGAASPRLKSNKVRARAMQIRQTSQQSNDQLAASSVIPHQPKLHSVSGARGLGCLLWQLLNGANNEPDQDLLSGPACRDDREHIISGHDCFRQDYPHKGHGSCWPSLVNADRANTSRTSGGWLQGLPCLQTGLVRSQQPEQPEIRLARSAGSTGPILRSVAVHQARRRSPVTGKARVG